MHCSLDYSIENALTLSPDKSNRLRLMANLKKNYI